MDQTSDTKSGDDLGPIWQNNRGHLCGASLFKLVSRPKLPFRWRLSESNLYLRDEVRNTVTSSYNDVAMAVSYN